MNQKYHFLLNEYTNLRFTKCTNCNTNTLFRKFRIVVHIDPHHLNIINVTCKFCKECEFVIIDKHKFDPLVNECYKENNLEIRTDPKYKIIGTLDIKSWNKIKKEDLNSSEIIELTDTFKSELNLNKKT